MYIIIIIIIYKCKNKIIFLTFFFCNYLDSVRSFLQRNRIGKFAENENLPQKDKEQESEENELHILSTYHIGDRCQVDTNENGMGKRGTIRYVGKTDFKPGLWIGVQYDEPLGKHNGT